MHCSNITPVDVKIYYEDGKPYLDYIGNTETAYGKLKIHIPKIGLDFSHIEDIMPTESRGMLKLFGLHRDIYAVDNTFYEVEILERNMTKNQIEKELGYKINIKDQFDIKRRFE